MSDQAVTEGAGAEQPSRAVAIELYSAAVSAVEPGRVTERAVDSLSITPNRRVWVYAFGKAAPAMAKAAVESLRRGRHEIAGGVVVGNGPEAEGTPAPFATIQVCGGDHPVPGRRSFAAAARIGQVSGGRVANDVALVLVSGGTSSLIAAPLRGMAETDLSSLYEALLGSGLDIGAMNAIRKRFSRWAAGRFALALSPSTIHCLAMSDVPGDDLASIGSGPCVPDTYTAAQVLEILRGAGLDSQLSAQQLEYLRSVQRGTEPETPKPTHPAFLHVSTRIIANNALALRGALEAARKLGFAAEIAAAPLGGGPAQAGREIARRLIASRREDAGRRCIIWGGETTVRLRPGEEARGGGRSQELALAAAQELAAAGADAQGILILAAGTDGRDGATNAAGACVDASTWDAIGAAGRDAAAALARHESNGALASAGEGTLIPAHSTGTNVTDVVIGLVA